MRSDSARHTFFERLRDLVARDESELALEQLSTFTRGSSPEAHRETLVQSSRLSRLRKEERRGFTTGAEVTRGRAQIADALLQLVDELAAATPDSERPFATPGVSLDPPASSALEKIIGANNLKSIAWLATGLEAARSVCRVVTPQGLGTGFLVEGGRLLTNYHVLANPGVAAASFAEFNFQQDAAGHPQPIYRYQLSGDGMKRDAPLDWSLVRVDESPSLPAVESWGTLALAADRIPGIGEHVSIIQHPGGGVKQIAVTANQVVNVFQHRLQYTTDTLPGSSGSPVFDDDWNVVALHHSGGNLVTNARGDRMFANEGILMAKILERIGR